eukprot:m.730175 g.730175  ORF g.730175 m.730175 type:complete len:309 (+) comp23053_c0_seq1:620-1546(+)
MAHGAIAQTPWCVEPFAIPKRARMASMMSSDGAPFSALACNVIASRTRAAYVCSSPIAVRGLFRMRSTVSSTWLSIIDGSDCRRSSSIACLMSRTRWYVPGNGASVPHRTSAKGVAESCTRTLRYSRVLTLWTTTRADSVWGSHVNDDVSTFCVWPVPTDALTDTGVSTLRSRNSYVRVLGVDGWGLATADTVSCSVCAACPTSAYEALVAAMAAALPVYSVPLPLSSARAPLPVVAFPKNVSHTIAVGTSCAAPSSAGVSSQALVPHRHVRARVVGIMLPPLTYAPYSASVKLRVRFCCPCSHLPVK